MKASHGRMRRIEKARDKAQKKRLLKTLKMLKNTSSRYHHLHQEFVDLVHKDDPIYQRLKLNRELAWKGRTT